MRRALLGVLVFPSASAALLHAHVRAGARIVAVDGGAEPCLRAGIVPDLVVGDMDSARTETLVTLAQRGSRIERHPSDKRDTDAALALTHLRDCDAILFIGAGGGRADHALANLHLLAEAARWAQVRAVDDEGETWVVTPEHPLSARLPVGTVLSCIPFDAEVDGICYEGLAFPLQDAKMRAGDPYGVSNVTNASEQHIQVAKGRLFVMRPTQGIS